MAKVCDVCSNKTDGWVQTLQNDILNIYCSYDCYKIMPSIIPTHHIYKCLKEEHNEKVILPVTIKKQAFSFLTETAINELTNEEYTDYKLEVDEQFLLNPTNGVLYYDSINSDKALKKFEEEFNESSSDDNEPDDY